MELTPTENLASTVAERTFFLPTTENGLTIKTDTDRIKADIIREAQSREGVDMPALEEAMKKMHIFFDYSDFSNYLNEKSHIQPGTLRQLVGLLKRTISTIEDVIKPEAAATTSKQYPGMYINAESLMRKALSNTARLPDSVKAEVVYRIIDQLYRHEREHIIRTFSPRLSNKDKVREVIGTTTLSGATFLALYEYIEKAAIRIHDLLIVPSSQGLESAATILVLTAAMSLPIVPVASAMHYTFFDEGEKKANKQKLQGVNLPKLFDIKIEKA